MQRRSARSRAAGLLAVGACVVLAPVLLAGPAMADDVIEEEPPGGAVCAPEIPSTDCEQESPAAEPAPTTQAEPASIPVTGGSPSTGGTSSSRPTLATTGATETFVVGATGAGLLLAGASLVAVARRRTA